MLDIWSATRFVFSPLSFLSHESLKARNESLFCMLSFVIFGILSPITDDRMLCSHGRIYAKISYSIHVCLYDRLFCISIKAMNVKALVELRDVYFSLHVNNCSIWSMLKEC